MVFRHKVLNLTRIYRTQSMTRKMFQIAIIVTSTVANPIALGRKKPSQEHESNQSERPPQLLSSLVAPVSQRKSLPTAADHRLQSPCAPWDRF